MPERLHIYYKILLKSRVTGPKAINYIIDKIKGNFSGVTDIDDKTIENIIVNELDSLVKVNIGKRFGILKKEAIKEEAILNKHNIKYIETAGLGYNEYLPPFIYYTGNLNINSFRRGSANNNGRVKNTVFITSSRYDGSKIYKLNENTMTSFKLSIKEILANSAENPLFFTGLSSEAEKAVIRSRMPEFPEFDERLIILPHESLLFYEKNYPFCSIFPAISIIDPFITYSKYAFAMRNKLALSLSDKLLIIYLSKKSLLSGLIENFKNSGKGVMIINNKATGTAPVLLHKKPKNFEFSDNEKLIIKYLNNKKVYIDNLINLSNIGSSEVLQIVSSLELKGAVKRLPGGLIELNR